MPGAEEYLKDLETRSKPPKREKGTVEKAGDFIQSVISGAKEKAKSTYEDASKHITDWQKQQEDNVITKVRPKMTPQEQEYVDAWPKAGSELDKQYSIGETPNTKRDKILKGGK
jgi:hypothetical protein